jgi:hypothetical protein
MNERTVVSSILPLTAAGNSLNLIKIESLNIECFSAVLSSFVCDFAARFKIGGVNLNFFIAEQLPVLPPEIFDKMCDWSKELTNYQWLLPRILELTYTAWDLAPFAENCGFTGPPFRWDEERRFLLRCELDAAFFHLYIPSNPDGSWKKAIAESSEEFQELNNDFYSPRSAVEYVMDSFPVVKKNDHKKFCQYRTKRVILEIYDDLQEAIRSDDSYKTKLKPRPSDISCCHKYS